MKTTEKKQKKANMAIGVLDAILKDLKALKDCGNRYYACEKCGVLLAPCTPGSKVSGKNRRVLSVGADMRYIGCYNCEFMGFDPKAVVRRMELASRDAMIKDFEKKYMEIK